MNCQLIKLSVENVKVSFDENLFIYIKLYVTVFLILCKFLVAHNNVYDAYTHTTYVFRVLCPFERVKGPPPRVHKENCIAQESETVVASEHRCTISAKKPRKQEAKKNKSPLTIRKFFSFLINCCNIL